MRQAYAAAMSTPPDLANASDGLALLSADVEVERAVTQHAVSNQDPVLRKPFTAARLLRYGVVISVVSFAIIGGALQLLSHAIEHGISGVDRSDLRGTIGLMDPHSWDPATPYRQVHACPDNGEVCICTDDYHKFPDQHIIWRRGSVACATFRFLVGDAIFFEKPKGEGPAFFDANLVAKYTNSPVIHAGIVSYVPPEQVSGFQNPDDIIVTEALKGNYKRVTQQTLRHVIQRWAFGGFGIRRVDPKYVDFPKHRPEITKFLNSVKGQPFDPDMVNPAKRSWATQGRFITPNPDCTERARAYTMYKNGGPGKWICSSLIAWTLAFPGGINLDYKNPYDQCTGPGWPLSNLQEWPGHLERESNIWDKHIQWHLPCDQMGCWVGAPISARWSGGHPPMSAAQNAPSPMAAVPQNDSPPATPPPTPTPTQAPIQTPATPPPTPTPTQAPIQTPVVATTQASTTFAYATGYEDDNMPAGYR